MKVAVVRFPGSNCDQDAFHALNDMGLRAEYVWHDAGSLDGFESVFVPGGFSYGDYLRCGAMAARSRIMSEVIRLAGAGHPVIGVCNGFQVLTEAGLLPGALLQNADEKFICQDVQLTTDSDSVWTREARGKTLRIPIAHGEGRYIADAETLAKVEGEGQVAFRYVENVNGSMNSIAGVVSPKGNVMGMMPHPERAANPRLGNSDGLVILRALELVKT
ncbi:MAG: phosphoribosylformylglycinamidine synthase subunit PurQ [Chthonomonas sp.]|nr:phosphoribosylformylglycinamidine synthase subunit PurQ [Chthonomonas sp.]